MSATTPRSATDSLDLGSPGHMAATSAAPVDTANRRLTIRILGAMGLGVLTGALINVLGLFEPLHAVNRFLVDYLANGVFLLVGQAFVRLLQVVVVPLVIISLVSGTAALNDIRQLGRISARTVGFYLATTAVAVTVALAAALIIQPGAGLTMETAGGFEPRPAPPLVQTLINIFPRNIFESMANMDMLPIILFSILIGIGMTLAGEAGARLLDVFRDLDRVIMRVISVIMAIAPYGVFALIARTFATEGFGAFLPLLKFVLLVLGVLLIHVFVVYGGLLKLFAGLNPFHLFRKIREVQLFAFSTASSNATIPLSLRTLEQKLGVENSIASFTVPLGATINMDGTAIMQGVATLFIAQVYGIDLGLSQLLMVVLTATLASIGTAGVPGVGTIMLSMVLIQVGLPVEGIALIMGVDRIVDMARTAVNVTGDCVVTCIIAKKEGKLNTAVFESEAMTTE